MTKHLLLELIFYGVLFVRTEAWRVTTPHDIQGLQHSCLVIPCSYFYTEYPPENPNRVVWYQYARFTYPVVYDNWYPNSVIDKFKGNTDLYRDSKIPKRECSLVIKNVDLKHHGEKVYPWIDPENVGASTYTFYDVITTIQVETSVTKPDIKVSNSFVTLGEPVKVECSVYHTCPYSEPKLSLNGMENKKHTKDAYERNDMGHGKWKVTLKREGIITSENQHIECEVVHEGGISAIATKTITAKCLMDQPKITSDATTEFLEGLKQKLTCSVTYICTTDRPVITWINESGSKMSYSPSGQKLKAESTYNFIPTADHQGKVITCKTTFEGNSQTTSITLKVKRGRKSLDWTYSVPKTITGLQGSCVVIPCKFIFHRAKPSRIGVKWYQSSDKQFPLVFEESNKGVINEYWKKTKVYREPLESNCTLEIKPVERSHNENKLYPWVDPNPIESFHQKDHYDDSVALKVTEQANKPELRIIGLPKVGEQITVSCSVRHTCPSSPPKLFLTKAQSNNSVIHKPIQDGIWEVISHYTFIIEEHDQSVTCKATFDGGQTTETQINLNAQCTSKDIIIIPEEADVTEGIASNFTCTVFHSCKNQPPTFSWNYKDMYEYKSNKRGPALTWTSSSSVLYFPTLEHDGKQLTCTARFSYGEFTSSVVLHVQKFIPEVVDPFENDTVHIFEANVVPKITALTRSCVVIPCTFQTGGVPILRLRGLWYSTSGEYVYHTSHLEIMDNFKARTKLLGNPDEQNCTLEIDDVQAHDNGPFCFHAEKDNDKYRFNHSCVFIRMTASPNKPVISPLPDEMEPGKKYTISCSITHTCSSHPPTLKWSVPIVREEVNHVQRDEGQWETISTITYIPTGYEKDEDLTCTAKFWKNTQEGSSTYLTVRRYEELGMGVIVPAIILPLVLILLISVFIGIYVYKKRKHRNTSDGDTQRSSQPLWSRLSRGPSSAARWIASVKGNRPPARPEKPEKRRSIWTRFSRRGPVNNADLTVQYNSRLNNTSTTGTGFSKPRVPSPKSNPRSYQRSMDSYVSDEDIYVNNPN